MIYVVVTENYKSVFKPPAIAGRFNTIEEAKTLVKSGQYTQCKYHGVITSNPSTASLNKWNKVNCLC